MTAFNVGIVLCCVVYQLPNVSAQKTRFVWGLQMLCYYGLSAVYNRSCNASPKNTGHYGPVQVATSWLWAFI